MNIGPENVNVQERLPIGGVFVFALGSIHSLRHLFTAWARHDSWLFWLLAGAVEAATAFLVWKLVEAVRMATKSNQKAEDRKFYIILAAVLLVLALPSLGVSVAANFVEFSGNVGLALLCPTMAVACAVLSALPEAERKFQERKRQEAEAAKRTKAANKREREKAKREAEKQRQADEQVRQLTYQLGATALSILSIYRQDPTASMASIASSLSISRQAVSQQVGKLKARGMLDEGNGDGVKVLVELPKEKEQ